MTCHKTTTVLCPSGGMADTPVLGTGVARREGSTPFSDTKTSLSNNTGIDSFISFEDYETNKSDYEIIKKFVVPRCCVEDRMLQSRKSNV